VLIGKSASPGVAIAKTLVLTQQKIIIEEELSSSIDRELHRFNEAIVQSRTEIQALHQKVLKEIGSDKAQIFEAHLLILEDPELVDSVRLKIQDEKIKATKALYEVSQMFISMFESMDQEYMRERALDIQDVSQRVLRNILGLTNVDLGNLKEPTIIVSQDITPSQMASLDLKNVAGIITEVGGKTSHTAIMARTLELPAVVGLKNATRSIRNLELTIVDGELGHVIPSPNDEILSKYNKKFESLQIEKTILKEFVGKPTQTKDGHQVFLEANIASYLDLDSVLKNDAEGVGLFRTEFIFMDRTSAPTEEEQFEIYKKVLERMGKKPTVIRTLDIGGDKNISYLKIPKEENPFLGFRAIRYCLAHVDFFKIQLRALLRASVYGNLHIMVPMISNLTEVLKIKSIIKEVQEELTEKKIPFSENFQMGIMIEIPSAAMMSDQLAKHVDFFSIGTNDLIQYMCAVDRMNENIHDLYDPLNPGVLKMIDLVIKNGQKNNIPVAMCGEMASNEQLTETLLGMGLTHFSMAPSSILKIRKKVSNLNYKEAQETSMKVLNLSESNEIKNLLN